MIQPCRKTSCCHTHFIAVPSSRFEGISFATITPAEMLFQDLIAAVIRGILILVLYFLFQSYYAVSFIRGNNYMPLLFYSPFGWTYGQLSSPFIVFPGRRYTHIAYSHKFSIPPHSSTHVYVLLCNPYFLNGTTQCGSSNDHHQQDSGNHHHHHHHHCHHHYLICSFLL